MNYLRVEFNPDKSNKNIIIASTLVSIGTCKDIIGMETAFPMMGEKDNF